MTTFTRIEIILGVRVRRRGSWIHQRLSLRKKTKKKKKNKADRNKMKKGSNVDGGSCRGVDVAPIFRSKGKVCRKCVTSTGMLVGLPLDALLTEHQSNQFADQRRLEDDRDR